MMWEKTRYDRVELATASLKVRPWNVALGAEEDLVFGLYQNLFTASAVVLGNITVLLIMHLHNAIYNVKECDDFENR
jgi:hypothetical protein